MNAEGILAQARLHVRHETQFKARLEVHPDHSEQYRLSYPDAATGLAVIDVSAGGLGLLTDFFMPKSLRVSVHVCGVSREGEAPGKDLAIRATVRRCALIDHKPTYQVGLQFVDATGADERALIRSVAASKATTTGRPEEARVPQR